MGRFCGWEYSMSMKPVFSLPEVLVILPNCATATWTLPEDPHLNIELIVDPMPNLHVGLALQVLFAK